MNTKFFAIAAIAATAVSANAVNILVNPGFETGNFAGWTTSGQSVQSSVVHTGQLASFSNGNFFIKQVVGAVATSSVNEISIWAMQPNVGSNYFFAFQVQYTDASWDVFVGGNANTGGWSHHDFTSQLDAGKSIALFEVYGYTSGQPNSDLSYFDDAVLDVVPEPATMAALGFGALALIRRKRK